MLALQPAGALGFEAGLKTRLYQLVVAEIRTTG
jgi:hypothetical protein